MNYLFRLLTLSIMTSMVLISNVDASRMERAGVALVKEYPGSQVGLGFAVLVGKSRGKFLDKHNPTVPHVNIFGGKIDRTDKYTTSAAVRELYEETGKAVAMDATRLLRRNSKTAFGSIKSQNMKIVLFFKQANHLSVSAITNVQKAACKNRRLIRCFRECDGTYAIPLQELLNSAKVISILLKQGKLSDAHKSHLYVLNSRGDGQGNNRKKVYLDRYYMKALAWQFDEFRKICIAMTNGKVS